MRCSKCGSEISPDLVFCINCGTLLGAHNITGEFDAVGDDRSNTEVLNEGPNRFNDTVVEPIHLRAKEESSSAKGNAMGASAFGSNVPSSSPARPAVSDYPKTPAMQPTLSQERSCGESDRRDQQKGNRAFAVVLVALAVVAVVALAVSLILILSDSREDSPYASGSSSIASSSERSSSALGDSADEDDFSLRSYSESESSSGKASDGMTSGGTPAVSPSGSSSSSSSSGLSDSEAYRVLVESLADIKAYDSEVARCANDFNSNYAKESIAMRSSEARAASSLKSEIKAEWENLRSIKVPFWSVNYGAWEDMCQLYEYLWNRIDVIDRAWKVSLSYEKPGEHSDEICAPLKAAQDSSGQNKDYVKFKALLSTVRLVKP